MDPDRLQSIRNSLEELMTRHPACQIMDDGPFTLPASHAGEIVQECLKIHKAGDIDNESLLKYQHADRDLQAQTIADIAALNNKTETRLTCERLLRIVLQAKIMLGSTLPPDWASDTNHMMNSMVYEDAQVKSREICDLKKKIKALESWIGNIEEKMLECNEDTESIKQKQGSIVRDEAKNATVVANLEGDLCSLQSNLREHQERSERLICRKFTTLKNLYMRLQQVDLGVLAHTQEEFGKHLSEMKDQISNLSNQQTSMTRESEVLRDELPTTRDDRTLHETRLSDLESIFHILRSDLDFLLEAHRKSRCNHENREVPRLHLPDLEFEYAPYIAPKDTPVSHSTN
ncbi:hypothetical protein SERLADRAFT_469841 [Serpula lacrymans var. lacrymans S7.9]|nr:uncharacterized protein SERLADRAFT_469841 [Serpula lacrymans var. lacrymans S7.9]EGO23665.1 hypothetical protein SERLADRAFT_469841 [Serpula lacrymans var. lacrymans S7.9]